LVPAERDGGDHTTRDGWHARQRRFFSESRSVGRHGTNGRAYLGIGAGWIERDYREYGYEFGTTKSRLSALESNLLRIRARLSKLNPPPLGALPILVGGSGEKVTLRLVASYADAWNSFGTPDEIAHKIGVLDDWCRQIGRDPDEIEKTVLIRTHAEVALAAEYVAAGATHLIWWSGAPYRPDAVGALMDAVT
jgi:alkanesulfonate monooxygenase SsuD/methylene tetrahydromethanopterin reductase-like flavin-dependent oxidoreductase (luciferase family)